MRPILYVLITLAPFLHGTSMAQKNGAKEKPETCYKEYLKVFESRGAKKVHNGTHENVVVTVRKGDRADCYIGKAKVKGGAVQNVQLMVADSSYEDLRYEYKHQEKDFDIVNGIAGPKVTDEEGKLVSVLFVEHIKPEQKEYMKAPEPDFD